MYENSWQSQWAASSGYEYNWSGNMYENSWQSQWNADSSYEYNWSGNMYQDSRRSYWDADEDNSSWSCSLTWADSHGGNSFAMSSEWAGSWWRHLSGSWADN